MVERMDIFTRASVGIVGAFKDMERKINTKASESSHVQSRMRQRRAEGLGEGGGGRNIPMDSCIQRATMSEVSIQ